MNYGFHHEAREEFLAAIDYYEECQPGLGLDFAREIHIAVQSILDRPETWPFVDENIHRHLIQRFPYGILYSEEGETVFILAITHLRREPGYWKTRLK